MNRAGRTDPKDRPFLGAAERSEPRVVREGPTGYGTDARPSLGIVVQIGKTTEKGELLGGERVPMPCHVQFDQNEMGIDVAG